MKNRCENISWVEYLRGKLKISLIDSIKPYIMLKRTPITITMNSRNQNTRVGRVALAHVHIKVLLIFK